jgi:peptidoglycan/LPS O-acetylase OafA/YrhL
VPAVGVLVLAQKINFDRFMRRAGYSVVLTGIAMATCLVIARIVLSPDSRLARFLSLKPMTQIGKVSYGLYLFHYPIFTVLALHSGLGRGPVLWIVQFALTGAVAWLSWVLLEQRVLALKSRFRGVRDQPAGIALPDDHLPSISLDSRLAGPTGRHVRASVAHRDPG